MRWKVNNNDGSWMIVNNYGESFIDVLILLYNIKKYYKKRKQYKYFVVLYTLSDKYFLVLYSLCRSYFLVLYTLGESYFLVLYSLCERYFLVIYTLNKKYFCYLKVYLLSLKLVHLLLILSLLKVLNSNFFASVILHGQPNGEPEECLVIQADDLLLQNVKTKRYVRAQKHEPEYVNIPEQEGTEVTYALKQAGKATLSYQIHGK